MSRIAGNLGFFRPIFRPIESFPKLWGNLALWVEPCRSQHGSWSSYPNIPTTWFSAAVGRFPASLELVAWHSKRITPSLCLETHQRNAAVTSHDNAQVTVQLLWKGFDRSPSYFCLKIPNGFRSIPMSDTKCMQFQANRTNHNVGFPVQ